VELPHLTMHLRQLGRSSARGTWLMIAVFMALIILRQVWGTELIPLSIYGRYAYVSQLLSIILGSFLLYWLIAQQMATLASDGRGHPPEWHSSLLSDSAALRGILARTVLTVLVPVGFLALIHLFDMHVGHFDARYYWTAFGLQVLRLPAYALFAGCLMLALRRSPALPYLPLALAAVATLCEAWSPVLILNHTHYDSEFGMRIALFSLLIGFAAQIILASWLTWLSGRERTGTGHYATALLLLGAAATLSVVSLLYSFTGVNVRGLAGHVAIVPLSAALGNIFPSICSIFPGPSSISGSPIFMITWLTKPHIASVTLAAAYLVAIPVWWRAAIGCLRAARHPVEARWTK